MAPIGIQAGTVSDLWVDRTEPQIRYFEVELSGTDGTKHVLLPSIMAGIDGARREVTVNAILARQFADVPGLASPTQVTKLEEDKITAYFAGGLLYATPARAEPLL